MQLAEELLLLLTDDQTGRMSVPERLLDIAVAGGALSELGAYEVVRVVKDGETIPGSFGEPVAPGRLAIDPDVTPPKSAVLDHTLEVFRGMQGRKLTNVLPIMGRALYPTLHRTLQSAGVVTRDAPAPQSSMFPQTTWKTVDASHEKAVRSHIADVLLHGAAPDDRARHLIGLLEATRTLFVAMPELVPDSGSDAASEHTAAEDTVLARAREVRALTDPDGPCGAVLAAVDTLVTR